MTEPTTGWEEIQNEIGALLKKHRSHLPHSTHEGVSHFLDHAEYEMALEGLCLDLMAYEIADVDWAQCRTLAERLGLDKESVFDPDFWSKLTDRLRQE